MIYLENRHLEIILNILKSYSFDFYIFGSRAKGDHKPQSDVDICVKGNISLRQKGEIMEAFDESKLPFLVDLVIWDRCEKSFKDLIAVDMKPLQLNNHTTK